MKKLFLFTLLFYGSYGYTAEDRIAQKTDPRSLNEKSMQFKKAVAGKKYCDVRRLIKAHSGKLNTAMVLGYTKKQMPRGAKRKFGRLVHIMLQEQRLKTVNTKYDSLQEKARNPKCKGLKKLEAERKAIKDDIQKVREQIKK